MDGAILVVSATDGPMPQTREHILLARQVSRLCLCKGFLIDIIAATMQQKQGTKAVTSWFHLYGFVPRTLACSAG